MNPEPWAVRTYRIENGSCPFDDWFSTLSRSTQLRIESRLVRVRQGNFGDYKSLGEGLYELRFFFGAGYRIYYATIEKRIVLLLAGGSKAKQSKDIRTARKLLNAYKSSS